MGIFLDKTACLGASPDGLVGSDGVLEIKCPFTLKNESVKEWVESHQKRVKMVTNVKNLPYVKAGPGHAEINPNHAYFAQVQAQLHLTG